MRNRVLMLVLALVIGGLALGGARARAQAGDPAEPEARRAAATLYDAVAVVDCDLPQYYDVNCISPASSQQFDAVLGIGVFRFASAGRGGGSNVVMGRTPSGGWGYWYSAQNTVYHRTKLPGAMIVCADGESANVRDDASLDASIITTLAEGTAVTALHFVLTQVGSPGGATGEGWYQITAPVSGWVYARLLSLPDVDGNQPLCRLRNLQQR